jgi:hypothetical protein
LRDTIATAASHNATDAYLLFSSLSPSSLDGILTSKKNPFFHHPCVQPFADQTQHPTVIDPSLNEPAKQIMINVIK